MLRDRELASYIADMVLELRNLAKGGEMSTLQGLLEITYYEAYAVAHKVDVPEGEEERLYDLGADARRVQAA
jgi:hypothetical protein